MSPDTPTISELEALHAAALEPAPKKTDFSGFGQFLRSMFSNYADHRRLNAVEKREAKRLNAARQAFNQRSKHTSHRLNCLQGYRAKAALVRQGKGRNSLAGVPSAYRGTPA